MCRIAGIYNPSSENLRFDIIRMRDSMRHGGPDDEGVFLHKEIPLALGHRRLSFLDLSTAGHQPMQSSDKQLCIIFNGEIYNFRELRKELKLMGYHFHTESDTEVVLISYRQWGKDCFARFNGMFAIALWDEKAQELVLARDHAGIKPLYFHVGPDKFVFASEIRAFHALQLWNQDAMWRSLFLLFGHLPEPFTTLNNVESLAKGTWMSVSIPRLHCQKGVFYEDTFSDTCTDRAEAVQQMKNILSGAVRRHLISDAPVGLFLSGGIDSSILTLLAQPELKEELTTLSIQFDEAEFSEVQYQKQIIEITNAKHSFFTVRQKDFELQMADIFEAMDQPSIDGVNVYFISLYAKRLGLKAVLSGLGADELFGGYPSFKRFRKWKLLQKLPKFITESAGKLKNEKISRLSFNKFHPILSLYLMNRGVFSVHDAAMLAGVSVREVEDRLAAIPFPANLNYTAVTANAAMELNFYMKNQLLRDADYMGMWHGIEIRVPFLDKELIEAVNSISPAVKFDPQLQKRLLIEAFATMLPAEIWNRKKRGFTFPFDHWLKQSKELSPSNAKETAVYDRFRNGKVHWSRYWAIKVMAAKA